MTLELGNRCLTLGCTSLATVRGMCSKHYKQVQRHGEASKAVSAKMIDGQKLSAHPLYETWRSITRIARGTRICEEWRDFEKFIEDVGKKPAEARGLRRRDVGLPFSKDNAYWYSAEQGIEQRALAAKRQSDFRAANPGYAGWASMKKNYGITQAEYEELSAKQGNVCAICKRPERRKTKGGTLMLLHVDHCHNTGRLRGLLCHSCNSALGHLEDSAEYLKSAISYLHHAQEA